MDVLYWSLSCAWQLHVIMHFTYKVSKSFPESMVHLLEMDFEGLQGRETARGCIEKLFCAP